MRRGQLAAIVCIAGLAAGCGSGSTNATTSGSGSGSSQRTSATATPASAIASLAQTPEAMGPPPHGARYDAVNHGFLERLATIMGHSLESQGLHDVNVTCTASVAARATCRANGIAGGGQSTSGTLMVMVDRTTGQLRFASK